MNRKPFCLLLSLLISCGCLGQTKVLDSLLREEQKHTKADTTLISLWNKIAYAYFQTAPAKGLIYADKAIALSKKLNARMLLADAYINKTTNCLALGQKEHVAEIFDTCMNIYNELGDQIGIANVLYSTANYYFTDEKLEQALNYFQQTLKTARASGYESMEERSLGAIGVVYLYLADYPEAINYSKQALLMAERKKKIGDIGYLSANLSYMSKIIGDFPQSIMYGLRAIEIARSRGDNHTLAAALINTGAAFMGIKQYKKGLTYLKEANEINKERGNYIDVTKSLQEIAKGNAYMGKMQEAIAIFNEAIALGEKIDYRAGVADNMIALASVYYETDSLDKCIDLNMRALLICNELKHEAGIAAAKMGLATAYLKLGRLKEARKPLAESYQMFEQQVDIRNLNVAQHLQSDYYEALGKYDSAYHYYQKFVKLKDSLLSDEKMQDIAQREAQFEFSRKEDSLKGQQALADEKIARQHTELILKTNRLSLREKELLLANKEKDLQHLAYLKTQLELSNQQAMTAEKEKEIRLAKLEADQKEQDIQLARKEALLQAVG
ncbi:MAG: tetratricopeptide repeat protein, partial [Bacteroidetes bacterium]|nr:tetratricopeptide repeat protein [Bacteroidota bacterium]